jgi:uncharacterized membrane protein
MSKHLLKFFLSKDSLMIGVSLIITGILLLLPTGYEGAVQFKDAVKCRAKIESVDNSSIIDTGLIRTGQQVCEITFLSGKFKGEKTQGWNLLTGSLAQDKLFYPGDKVQCLVQYNEENGKRKILSVNLIDYFRLHGELLLAFAFAFFLIIFSGFVGVRSVFSFIITILCLWKILVPLYLKGCNPIFIGFLVTAILTAVIIVLVYGFNKKFISAFTGAMLGIGFAALLSILCTKCFYIHGAVMANSEALLYSGFQYLNLTEIFMASVCIGASGSIMDLSVDITSAVSEVVKNCPSISAKNAVKSGLAVARAAMGTMTTTLLLAYSGTCIALLMTFMAQGTPLYNIFNNNVVASEIINTVAGSFGLASTAPFTALVSGLILTNKKQVNSNLTK